VEHEFCNASCNTNFNRKGASYMALLKAPSKQPKTTNLQVRLEEEVRRNLDRYAQFLDANPSYVVSEALKFLFRKDDEFKRWADAHSQAADDKHESIQGDALKKTA
jgi:predicted transcriptional regulator